MFVVFLSFFFGPQDNSKPSRLHFSIQIEPVNADFRGFGSDSGHFGDLGILDFWIPGFWPLDFGVFGSGALILKAITSQASPPGGQNFQK